MFECVKNWINIHWMFSSMALVTIMFGFVSPLLEKLLEKLITRWFF